MFNVTPAERLYLSKSGLRLSIFTGVRRVGLGRLGASTANFALATKITLSDSVFLRI